VAVAIDLDDLATLQQPAADEYGTAFVSGLDPATPCNQRADLAREPRTGLVFESFHLAG
jgi:hypothetical protein